MHWLFAFSLVAAAGCNQVLGLDETRPAPAANLDADDDGVVDDIDNCPSVPNLMQADVDGDAIGDVCDPCSWHISDVADDDEDTIANAADACPGAAPANQSDDDGDGIANRCDPQPDRPDVRTCFEDFAADVATAERTWAVERPWSIGGSQLLRGRTATSPGPATVATLASGITSELAAFALETRYSIDMLVDTEGGIGVGALDAVLVRCVLRRTGTAVSAAIVDRTETVLAEQPVTSQYQNIVHLLVRRSPEASAVTCRVRTGENAVVTLTATVPALVDPVTVSLHGAQGQTTFRHVAIYALGD